MLYFLRGMSMAELDLRLCNTSKSLFLATEHGPGPLPPLGHLWIKNPSSQQNLQLVHVKMDRFSSFILLMFQNSCSSQNMVTYPWTYRVSYISGNGWMPQFWCTKPFFFEKKTPQIFGKLHWKNPKTKHSSYHGTQPLKALEIPREPCCLSHAPKVSLERLDPDVMCFWEIWKYSRFYVGCSRSLL